jgi:hypothetical protein
MSYFIYTLICTFLQNVGTNIYTYMGVNKPGFALYVKRLNCNGASGLGRFSGRLSRLVSHYASASALKHFLFYWKSLSLKLELFALKELVKPDGVEANALGFCVHFSASDLVKAA